ncbi:MAG: hypothetical protein SNJ56_06845 [Termitinemataceae bacterium]
MIWQGPVALAAEWYRSNAGGLALERIAQAAALREDYALEVSYITLQDLPEQLALLVSFEAATLRLERLYRQNKPIQERFFVFDRQNRRRLIAQLAEDSFSWIERYDIRRQKIDEWWRVQNGPWWYTQYEYRDSKLIGAVTYQQNSIQPDLEAPVLFRDSYFYTRIGALRKVERLYTTSQDQKLQTLWFPLSLNKLEGINAIGPGALYKTQGTTSAIQVTYTLDSRGRVVKELHKNLAGNVVFEQENLWDGDRLVQVIQTEGSIVRKTLYTYDTAGNRILEQNYVNSVLERQVNIEGKRETEELYLEGRLVLITVWEDGKKISEKPQPMRSRP